MTEEEFLNEVNAGKVFFSEIEKKLLEDLVNEYKTDSRKVKVHISGSREKLDRFKLLKKKMRDGNS